MLQMFFHGPGADTEDHAYLGIGLAFGYPSQYLDLSLSKSRKSGNSSPGGLTSPVLPQSVW